MSIVTKTFCLKNNDDLSSSTYDFMKYLARQIGFTNLNQFFPFTLQSLNSSLYRVTVCQCSDVTKYWYDVCWPNSMQQISTSSDSFCKNSNNPQHLGFDVGASTIQFERAISESLIAGVRPFTSTPGKQYFGPNFNQFFGLYYDGLENTRKQLCNIFSPFNPDNCTGTLTSALVTQLGDVSNVGGCPPLQETKATKLSDCLSFSYNPFRSGNLVFRMRFIQPGTFRISKRSNFCQLRFRQLFSCS